MNHNKQLKPFALFTVRVEVSIMGQPHSDAEKWL